MFKRPHFVSSGTGNVSGTQPFRINIDSDESSVESEPIITNAQTCKLGHVVIEMTEGDTGNFSSSSAQAQSTTRSTPTASVQPPITKHFVNQPKKDVKNSNPQDDIQASASTSQAGQAGPSIGGTYSLVRSGIALSNL